MKQKKTLIILISLFILVLIAIPYTFAADIDNINNLNDNTITTKISQSDNNILSTELNEETNGITAEIAQNKKNLTVETAENKNSQKIETKTSSFNDNSRAEKSLNENAPYEDGEISIKNSAPSKKLSSEDDEGKHIYFDASLANDNGDGSALNPYKYFNASKLIANHTIHLANGEYLLDGWCNLKNLTIIGSENINTILKYKHLNYNVFTTSNFINLTLSAIRLTNGGIITATNCIFKDASPTSISSGSNNAYEVKLKNCTFIKNNGEDGGAICMKGGKLYMEDCFFINNTATQYGGAIYLTNMNQTIIKNTQIIGSKSNDGVGGGIFICLSKFNASNLEIINSSAKFGAGMGILNSNINLNSIRLINNTAKYDGGAIYQMYGNFTLNNAILENNSANNGGGLFIDNASNAHISNTDFIRNNASMTGGAIYSLMNNNTNIAHINDLEYGNSFKDNLASSFNDIFEANHLNLNIISENYSMYKVNETEIIELPSYYSLVDEGYVSSVKNQGIGGNCWAFSAIAVLESCILKAGGDLYDFSENNMKNIMSIYSDYGWRMKPNRGGYDAMAMAYLNSWLGPVLETEDPYNDEDMISPLLNGTVHVQNILFLESKDGQDTEEIKKALMKYGAVATGIYYNDAYLNGTAYYYNGTEHSDHGVTIVGWDDNYSAGNFKIAPPGDGAWIVKNSWGPYWGDNGYFYVSYYDKVIARKEDKKETFTIILNDTIKLEKNYQYDIGKNKYMHNNYSTVWYKNKFIAEDDELLAAVSTYFKKNTDFEVSIIVNGENKHSQTGSALPGYFTFNLNNFIPLEKGDVFEVVFKITVDEAAAIPILTPLNEINKKTFDKNMSFLSYDGKNWEDISLYRVNIWTEGNITHAANFISQVACIKAFTIINPLETVTSLDIISSALNSVKLVSSVKDKYNNTVKIGNIVFNINGKEILAEIINGTAELLYDLDKLTTNVTASFIDNHYMNSSNSTIISIPPINVDLDIKISTEMDSANISITASKEINAPLKISINEKEYDIELINGKGYLNLDKLEVGNYTVMAQIENEIFNCIESGQFNIELIQTRILGNNLTTDDFSCELYEIILLDKIGQGISNKTIDVLIKEVNSENNSFYFSPTTDDDGRAEILIDLKGGNYTITLKFNEDNKYASAEENYSLKVKDKISLSIETEQNINNLEITIQANKSINETIKLYVNNQTYQLQLTNGKTTKQLNNLENGNYTIKAELTNTEDYITTTEEKTIEINIKSMNIIANDMEITSNSNINYYIKLIDENNNPINNKSVTIKLNNQTYTKTTNSQGEANITINLPKGTYTINISFQGDKQYYNTNTNKTIKAKEPITLNINTEQNINNLEITIKANKSINETIKLYVNKQTYQLQLTNGKTSKQLNNLENGNYTIKTELTNTQEYITNTQEKTIEINIKQMIINAENIEIASNTNENYQIKLTDENNKPINNKTITIKLNNQTYTKTTNSQGEANITINLPKGTYTINISFPGDKQYYNTNTNKTIKAKEPITLNINTEQNINNLKITIQANKNINETIKLYVNNQSYQLQLNNGQTTKQLNKLQNGNYTIKTELTNTDEYITSTEDKTIEININPVNIIANDLETTTNSNENYYITIFDINNQAFAEKTVIITLNNQTYTKTTDSEGKTSIPIKLEKGTYTITITTLNDNEHASTSLNKTIKVKEPITLNIETKQTINNLKITIQANKSINEIIKLYINNQSYQLQLNNGQTSKNLSNLENGNYTIKTELTNTEEYITNTEEKTIEINLRKPIIIANNMETAEGSTILYTATIFNDNYYALSNKTVIITVNNQTYTKTTTEFGLVFLEIKLPKGTYEINIRTLEDNEYLSSNVTSTIKVKGVINLDISISQNMNNLNVTVKSDKKINKTLTLQVNNENYTLELKNGEGQKEIKNLENGNYTISAIINNPEDDIVNIKTEKIEINLNKINIMANNFETSENSGNQYIITLKDENNKSLSNREITINLNNQTYTKTTNSQGETRIPINLSGGTYTIKISFKGDNNYYSAEEIRTIKVKEILTIHGNLSKKSNNIRLDINLSKCINETLNISLSNKNTGTIKNYSIATKDGQTSLKISDLENGDYEISVSINNSSKYESNILSSEFNINIIKTKIIADNQAFKEYLNESYQIILVDENDNPIANKDISIILNGSTFQKTTDNTGKVYQNINLKEGTYPMDIKFSGDEKYLKSDKSITITVIKERISLNIDINTDLDVAKINIKADKNINDTIDLSINNSRYDLKLVNGIGTLELNELKDGKYIITVKNDKLGISESKEFNILNEYLIIADDLTCYNMSNSMYTIQFVNGKKPMANKTIQFNLDGKTISKTTDNNGKTSININLNPGVYDIVIKNLEVGINSTKKINVISLNETIRRQHTRIILNDMITTAITKTKDRNGEWFVFKLVDENDNILRNKPISVGFNGKVYNKTTNENGEAKLQINLVKAFTYTFAIAFLGDDEYYASFDVAKITVKPQKASLTVPLNYYKLNAKTKQVTATFKDSRGIAVKGKEISFTVNGKTYLAKTNSKGLASVKVSLNKKGSYKLISKFEGDNTFSKITKTSYIIVI